MTKNKKTANKKTTKRKMDVPGKIILIGGLIILIPILIFSWILISASMDTGKPLFGNRFAGDLDPAIKNSELTAIEGKIKDLSDIDKVSINLASATVRVTVDMKDSATLEEAKAKLDEVYKVVLAALPEETYFTSTTTKRMYDLEINVHNLPTSKSEEAGFILVGRVKNAMNQAYTDQVLSEPRDADLAQELRDDVEARLNPTTTPADNEITVGGTDDGNEEKSPETPTETPAP